MKKILLFLLVTIFTVLGVAEANTINQTIFLKTGFNFVAFSVDAQVDALIFKSGNNIIDDVYYYSASAGSFLSINEGTLTKLSYGKGYIIKCNNNGEIIVNGSDIFTVGNISVKKGFNLIGISKQIDNMKYTDVIKTSTDILGVYKWSNASGSFIQVIKNLNGLIELSDGVDPQVTVGQSLFINAANDFTLNYDNSKIIINGNIVNSYYSELSISQKTIDVELGSIYDLSKIITSAIYSNGDKKIINPLWKVSSGNASISGSILVINSNSSDLVLTASYEENNILKTEYLQVNIKKIVSLTFDKTLDTIEISSVYNLNNIKCIALYSDYSTKEVKVSWTANIGKINDLDNTYKSPDYPVGDRLTALYVEGQTIKNAVLSLNVVKSLKSIYLKKNNLILRKSPDETLILDYDLPKLIALYLDQSTKEIDVQWKLISGNGKIINSIYYIPTAIGDVNLQASYAENGINKTENLYITISDYAILPIKNVYISNSIGVIESTGYYTFKWNTNYIMPIKASITFCSSNIDDINDPTFTEGNISYTFNHSFTIHSSNVPANFYKVKIKYSEPSEIYEPKSEILKVAIKPPVLNIDEVKVTKNLAGDFIITWKTNTISTLKAKITFWSNVVPMSQDKSVVGLESAGLDHTTTIAAIDVPTNFLKIRIQYVITEDEGTYRDVLKSEVINASPTN